MKQYSLLYMSSFRQIIFICLISWQSIPCKSQLPGVDHSFNGTLAEHIVYHTHVWTFNKSTTSCSLNVGNVRAPLRVASRNLSCETYALNFAMRGSNDRSQQVSCVVYKEQTQNGKKFRYGRQYAKNKNANYTRHDHLWIL